MICRTAFLMFTLIAGGMIAGCAKSPNLDTVEHFDANRYSGMWYEIARMPNRFERNLSDVTATYVLDNNQDVRVINRGWDTRRERWKEARGRARVKDTGELRVSFFQPFWSDYNVVALDDDYQWAMVTSGSRLLWILAREPQLDDDQYNELVAMARDAGYDTDELERPTHDRRRFHGLGEERTW